MRKPRLPALLVAAHLATAFLAGCAPRPTTLERPTNIVWIVVDTLRADHLPFYGYGRDTAPDVARLIADRGTLFEHAYSQAAWTSPSAASYLTGLYPAKLWRGDIPSFGVPPDVPTLAERLRAAGFHTAAFVGNTLLHRGLRFNRGFDEYWIPPGGLDAMQLHAEAVLEPTLRWLDQRKPGAERNFLYVHFIDPHDPYDNPDLVDGRTPWDPDYRGRLRGADVQGLYEGKIELDAGSADLRHLTALYDSEILHVDRAIGKLITECERRLGRGTLYVFSADHGEELFDHQGWKHGHTLFEESIRVPLVLRLDGSIPAGKRTGADVELLDIAPTLLEASGVAAEGLDGESLVPLLLDLPQRKPRRPVFARHWQFGPLRAALVEGRRKTILFNSLEPFQPSSPLEAAIDRRDRARLLRDATYDLERDPGERSPIATEPGAAAEIERRIDPTLDGVRVVVNGLAPGSVVSGSLAWHRRPLGIVPLFLADADDVEVDGREVRFRLTADRIPKGFTVQGRLGALEALSIDPPPGTPSSVALELGEGGRWVGTKVPLARLQRAESPRWAGGPELRIWTLPKLAEAAAGPDHETLRRLHALGYL